MSRFAERNGKTERENSVPSLMVIVVSLCAGLFIVCLATGLFSSGTTQNFFYRANEAAVPLSQQFATQERVPPLPVAEPEMPRLESPHTEKSPEMQSGDFYRFTDRNGVIHMVNDPDRIPAEYRTKVLVTKAATSETPVRVTPQGHVLVPVTFYHRGKSATATLMLDTGATNTIISEKTAAELGLQGYDVRRGSARVADGRSVPSYEVALDSIRVGSKKLSQVPVAIIPFGGNRDDHDGLLGMSFLKAFRYQVDLSGQKIVWR